MDSRWKRLADILVGYSVEVQAGERVMIAMSEIETFPLCKAVYEACIKAGAYPQVQFLSESLRHLVMKHGSSEQIGWVPELEAYGMEWADVYIGLRGAHNLYEHEDIPSETLALNQKAMGKVASLRWEKTRWVLVRVPNESFAQQAHTDIDTMMDMFFSACFVDWKEYSAHLHRIAELLSTGSEIRIVAENTDLRFSVAGRTWIAADGRINMPDGEIFTAPVTETLHGAIAFEFPAVFGGRLIPGIRLRWDRGRLVEASASANEEFLREIVSADRGASLLGEFAFGMNKGISLFCRDILLDEKIGGTVHVALGRAYPECGGTNASAIHLDIIKDTRKNGSVYLDDRVIFKNGEFTV